MAPSQGCELTDFLVGVLSRFSVPISLSFINSSLSSILQQRPKINEHFIKERSNLFSFSVIGNDLKITLKKDTDTSDISADDSVGKLSSVIEKDHRKVQTLVELFAKEGRDEVAFEELITKYNSNKRQINVSFVVRNSHRFRVFSRNDKTFVQILKDEKLVVQMDSDGVLSHLESCSLETIMARCLWSLLSCFYEPVNLGNFQSCYSLGSTMIDSGFLGRYRNIFSLVSKDGNPSPMVELRSECREMDAWAEKNYLLPKVEQRQPVSTKACSSPHLNERLPSSVKPSAEQKERYERCFNSLIASAKQSSENSTTTLESYRLGLMIRHSTSDTLDEGSVESVSTDRKLDNAEAQSNLSSDSQSTCAGEDSTTDLPSCRKRWETPQPLHPGSCNFVESVLDEVRSLELDSPEVESSKLASSESKSSEFKSPDLKSHFGSEQKCNVTVNSSSKDIDGATDVGQDDLSERIHSCVSGSRSLIAIGCHDVEPVALYACNESDNANRVRVLKQMKEAVKMEMEKNVKLLMENIS